MDDPELCLRCRHRSRVFCSKDASGYRRPANRPLLVISNRKRFLRLPTNFQILDCFGGKATYYVRANGRIRVPYTLLIIDIDNHKVGTLTAALTFAQYLKDYFFPNLYFEPFKCGKGVHGYVLIDKRGIGDERLHGLAKMLDRALKVVHKKWQEQNPDLLVEGVEIKGHPPRITWTRDGQMKDLISGQFAKLPRQLLSRFDEFKKTNVLNDRRISQLYLKYKDEPVVPAKQVVEPAKKSGSLTGCVVKQVDIDTQRRPVGGLLTTPIADWLRSSRTSTAARLELLPAPAGARVVAADATDLRAGRNRTGSTTGLRISDTGGHVR